MRGKLPLWGWESWSLSGERRRQLFARDIVSDGNGEGDDQDNDNDTNDDDNPHQ